MLENRAREDKVVKHTTTGRGHFLVLKYSRQFPLVLLEVYFRDVRTLGSEKSKGLRCGYCYERR
jgi:predicted adenine nucleotide alpha hydrolase (AANH) superfamily ATPase